MARVDWSASEHWSPERKTCRSCGASTTCVTAEAGRRTSSESNAPLTGSACAERAPTTESSRSSL